MRRTKNVWILAAVALLLAHPPLMAQETASIEFPNDKNGSVNNVATGASGDMSIRANITDAFLPNIVTAPIPLEGPMTGRQVATDAYNALCTAAEDAGYICNGSGSEDGVLCGPGQLGNPSCCDDSMGIGPSQVTCQSTANPSGEFKGVRFVWGVKDSGHYGIEIEPFASAKLKAVNAKTKAGNTIIEDILPRFCLRVDRDGAAPDGAIKLSVTRLLLGLPITLTIAVDSTGLDDAALHEAIAGGLEGLPLDLGIHVLSSPGDKCEFDSTFSGPLISISNIVEQGVTAIGLSGLEGQDIIVEQSRGIANLASPGGRNPSPPMLE